MSLESRLVRALKQAGVEVTGVVFHDRTNKATWTVQPANLQNAAQPIIDAFVITTPPTRAVVVPGSYLGALDADPGSPKDGDFWIVRTAYPTQRRELKFRDGDVTRTFQTIVL